jgi:translation initiation factor 1
VPSPHKKVPVSGPKDPLQSPFAALNLKGLPEGLATEKSNAEIRRKRPRVVLRREKARRGGKTVVVVSQIPTHLSPPEITALLQAAKKSLGCGGTVEGREIELQGDQPDRVRTFLESHNFSVGGV